MAPFVMVVTAAWNQVDVTLACLKSLFEIGYPNFKVIVVDNGSREDLSGAVSASFPDVYLIRSEQNLGFAGGFNLGITAALELNPDYVYVINNDIIFDSACLENLVSKAQAHESVGLVTSKMYYLNDPQRIWRLGGTIHPKLLEVSQTGNDQIDSGQFDQLDEIDFAPLCSSLIPADAFRQIGLLDEDFFVYYEDMDFCLRLKQAGLSLYSAQESKIWHAVSVSSGGNHSPGERYWSAQGSGRYFRKHGRFFPLLFFIVPYRLGSAIKMSFTLLMGGKLVALRAYWLGLWRGWSTGKATAQPPQWVK